VIPYVILGVFGLLALAFFIYIVMLFNGLIASEGSFFSPEKVVCDRANDTHRSFVSLRMTATGDPWFDFAHHRPWVAPTKSKP
jgi:hypothetical protein